MNVKKSLTNVAKSLTNDYICSVKLKFIIMWLLILTVPFVSLLVVGYIIYDAPEVSNDIVE
jgi:hypothetical protein